MANKRVFKLATASAVAASALVAAVPASAATVTYEQAEKQVNLAREAAYGLHAAYTKDADYENKVDIKLANDQLNRAKAKIAALSDAKQKAYLTSRIQGVSDTVARANAYNNAVRVGTEILPAAQKAVVEAADVASLKEGNVLLAAKIKQAKETFAKVYGKEIQGKFTTTYLTAELEADRKDGHYAAITADRVAEGLKLVAEGKVEDAEKAYNNAKASFDAVKGLESIKAIIAADWTELGKKIEAAKTPKVESVSAINAKQIVVKFNKTLLGTDNNVANDATDVANYELDGLPVDGAELSADGKSVTLTVDLGVEGDDRVLVVNPVATTEKDADGAIVATEKYSQILSFEDTVKPHVVSTTYSNGVITLEFSEAIGTLPTVVRVNGTPVTTIGAGDAPNKVDVTTTLAAGSTASLYVAGAKDASDAENEMGLYTGTVIAPTADTGKPQITSVQVTGQNTATVKLSEDIAAATVVAKLQKGTTLHDVTLSEDTDDETGKTYTLTVDLNGTGAGNEGDGIFSGTSTSETFSLLVAAEAMTDLSGNKNEEFITNVTFVKDTTAPSLVNAQVASDSKKINFTFSEDLTLVGSATDITVKNSDGVKITDVAESALKGDDASVYLVDLKTGDTAIAAGTYTISIPAGYFTDAYGNESAAITRTLTVGAPSNSDTTKPTATVTNVLNEKNQFQVVYDDEVSANALSLSSYKLDGKALPTGTEIYFTSTDKDTVIIELPTGSINIGDQTNGASAIFTVSNVTDLAGNVINTANTSVVVKDNTAASITNVQVIGQDVYVTFNEDVTFGTVDANDAFDVKVSNAAVEAGNLSVVAGNDKQVKFTLAAPAASTPVVTVKASQVVLTDANGVAVK